jgi:uncharacterized protein (DUF302 family)
MTYAIHTEFPKSLGFDHVEGVLREILAENGFGILTEIDVKATMKKKLDIDQPPYKILGACNPPRAHQAISGEGDIGILLPCNWVIYEKEELIRVAATKASNVFTLVDNPAVAPVAAEVDEIFSKVMQQLKEKLQ